MESYDPVLNPVLNREVRRTGGRVLITLGDQDIDLSPSFVIFLSTRDPTVSRGHLGDEQDGGVSKRLKPPACLVLSDRWSSHQISVPGSPL